MNILSVSLIICASLLIITLPATGTQSCTSLTDLAEPCGCTLTKETFDPVCGSDGNSYMNLCFLDCKQTLEDKEIKVDHKGACSTKTNCVCPSTYDPVCASNGVTYPNECVLKCNVQKIPSLKLKYKSVCDDVDDFVDETRLLRLSSVAEKCTCNPSYGPVCDSNGVTYPNYCVLRCKASKDSSIKFNYWGRCEERNQVPKTDREELKLVTPSPKKTCGCGSVTYYTRCGNGGKYTSPCEVLCDSYKRPTTPKPYSPCDSIVEKVVPRPEEQKLNQVKDNRCYCTSVNRPVCGTNGLTYTNNCVLHCTTKKDPSVTFMRWGACGPHESSDEQIQLISRIKNWDVLRKAKPQRGVVRFELQSFRRRRS